MIYWLLVKHFFADFPLQTPYMLRKGQAQGWALPLAAHCTVHALLTAAILLAYGLPLWWAVAESVAHFGIDRLKAHPKLGGRWTPASPFFWWALGADQLAHGLCYAAMVSCATP